MIGFIGAGSMGSALLRGVLSAGTTAADTILFSRKNAEAGKALARELGVHFVSSNTELVRAVGAGIVVIAVKPHQIGAVLDEISAAAANAGTVIVSVAAGTNLAALQSHLNSAQPIVRAMPNVASSIGMGMTAMARVSSVSGAQFDAVCDLFKAAGGVIELPEQQFSAFTAIAGSSPAWTFQYIDALSRGALANGMSKADSLRCAAQAVLGAAQLVLDGLDQNVRPQALIDTVTSPGGTTVAGLIAAENSGFTNATIAAVQACIARDQEMVK